MISKIIGIIWVKLVEFVEDIKYFILRETPTSFIGKYALFISLVLEICFISYITFELNSILFYTLNIVAATIWFFLTLLLGKSVKSVKNGVECFISSFISSWYTCSIKNRIIFSVVELLNCIITFTFILFDSINVIDVVLIFSLISFVSYMIFIVGIKLIDEEGEDNNEIFTD